MVLLRISVRDRSSIDRAQIIDTLGMRQIYYWLVGTPVQPERILRAAFDEAALRIPSLDSIRSPSWFGLGVSWHTEIRLCDAFSTLSMESQIELRSQPEDGANIMRNTWTKSLAVAAVSSVLVVGGAGMASADTSEDIENRSQENNTQVDDNRIEDSGNVSLDDILNDVADVDDVASDNNVLSGNDTNVSDNLNGNLSGNDTDVEANPDTDADVDADNSSESNEDGGEDNEEGLLGGLL
jgi:hypothetical protein